MKKILPILAMFPFIALIIYSIVELFILSPTLMTLVLIVTTFSGLFMWGKEKLEK